MLLYGYRSSVKRISLLVPGIHVHARFKNVKETMRRDNGAVQKQGALKRLLIEKQSEVGLVRILRK